MDMDGPARILVADDAPSINLLVRKVLENAGYVVTAVTTGSAAYESGLTGGYSLAIIDHFMPGMLGTEVLQKWRQQGITMPVLLLSGSEDDHTVAQTQGADFVLKPFNVRELVTKVRSHIGR
jgi:DNA-binding response OmpR family regulator